MRITPPFHCIEPWIMNDPRVRSLDREARSLFQLLLMFPTMSKVPGLILNVGKGAMCDEFQSSESEFLDCFGKLVEKGLCDADWTNRVVFVKPLLTEMVCNRPRGPSQAAAFGTVIFRIAPDCALVREVDHHLRELMCTSPSLSESYLRCASLSSADALAKRQAGQPLRSQPRQLGLVLPETGSASMDAAEETVEDAAHSQSNPTLPGSVEAGAAAEAELQVGLKLLQLNAGTALDGLSESQVQQLRMLWTTAFGAGWRAVDLGDLGSWIAGGGLKWLSQVPPAAYVAAHLGNALAKMDEFRRRSPLRAPARVPTIGTQLRLRWTTDNKGRICGVDDGSRNSLSILGDSWEGEVLRRMYERYMRGEQLTMAEIRAALDHRPASGDDAAVHAMTQEIEAMQRGGSAA